MTKHQFTSIDEYHETVSPEIRAKLEDLRQAIRKAAPDAEEVISYNMPAFKQGSVLAYYAAAKAHIGFYPTPAPIAAFQDVLQDFKTSKGAIQFPLDKPLPLTLVRDMVQFRLAQVADAALAKKKKPLRQ